MKPFEKVKPSDILIRGREQILDLFTSGGSSLILNPHLPKESRRPGNDIAAELKRALQDLLAMSADTSGTGVDYVALRSSPAYVAYRERCLSQLHLFDPQALHSTNAQRAFWINLYNTLVIDAVLALDVERSVTDGLFGLITFFRRAAYMIGDHRVSLDDIEHGILRGNRGHPLLPGAHFASDDPRLEWALPLDPRIHFALNCGARSCPPIRSYEPEKLDAQLDLAARSFLYANTTIREGEVCLSKLFHWYRADFGGREGVRSFLLEHLNDDQSRELLSKGGDALSFRYTPYDWSLNTPRLASW